MPGFRKGKVPAGLINKRFGTEVKMNEINRLVGENLQKFIEEKKLSVLGEPMMSEQQQAQDIENQDDFEFKFDIALAPEFKVELTDKDQLTYYDVEVSEEQVDEQVKLSHSKPVTPKKCRNTPIATSCAVPSPNKTQKATCSKAVSASTA